MTRRSRRRMSEALADAGLEQRCRAWLAANPNPDNEFDGVCREAMQRFIDTLDKEISAQPTTQTKARKSPRLHP